MGEGKRKEAARLNGYVKCCMNCDAWERKSAGNKMGQCRAHAPVVLMVPVPQQLQNGQVQLIPSVDGYWPPTTDSQWCREHQLLLAPAIADRDALDKIGNLDSLELPAEGNAD